MAERQNKPVVALGNICSGDWRIETIRSILAASQHDGDVKVAGVISVLTGPYLDDGRNRVVEQFMRDWPECDWLLFFDSDIEFEVGDVDRLITAAYKNGEVHKTLICGWYKSPYPLPVGVAPVVMQEAVDEPDGTMNLFPYLAIEDIERRRVPFKVSAAGTGFMAIHRSLLHEMGTYFEKPIPWFAEPVYRGAHIGEDLGFCLRARHLGHPTWVHPKVLVAHYKVLGFK